MNKIWYQFKEQRFIFQMRPLAFKCLSGMDWKIFENLEKAWKLPRLLCDSPAEGRFCESFLDLFKRFYSMNFITKGIKWNLKICSLNWYQIWIKNFFRTTLNMTVKKASLHIYGVRQMFNSVSVCRTRLTRLRNESYSDSFQAVFAWSCGRAKCQCCTATVTVVVY